MTTSDITELDGAKMIRTAVLMPGTPTLAVFRPAVDFQDRVRASFDHVCEGDGVNDPTTVEERRDRLSEEALELIQALGGTREGMHALVDYVFARPVGEAAQEMGGTMVTLAALASYAGLDMLACGEAELARCSSPEVVAKIRRKRAARHGRGSLPGVEADVVTMRRTAGVGKSEAVASAIFKALTPDPDQLITEVEAAVLLTLKPRTLQVWRMQGTGPAFIKVGSAVRYRRRTISEWLATRTATLTGVVPA